VDERVECRGRTDGSFVCPCGLSHMDKLHVLLMPPRNIMSLFDGATSSSMLHGDSEIEYFREELDGTSDDGDHVRGRCSWPFSSCLATQIHKRLSRGFLACRKMHKESIWKDKNSNQFSRIFREGSEAQIFLSGS
jgi:hypothetical protein